MVTQGRADSMPLENSEDEVLQGKGRDRSQDRSVEKRIETQPVAASWGIIAIAAIVPIGLGGAATATTYLTNNENISMTAWIAVAVVGTATMISASIASMHRQKFVDRDIQGERSVYRRPGKTRPSDSGLHS